MPDSQTLFVVIIALLVLDIAVTARVAQVATQSRDTLMRKPNGAPTNTQLIETMATQVAGIDREMFPKDGSTISRRIDDLTKLSQEAASASTVATANSRSAIEEARNAFRTASDERARTERLVTTLQTTTDGLLVASARTTEAAVKIIQNTVQGTQSTVEATNSKIEQLAAGSGIAQALTKSAEPLAPSAAVEHTKPGIHTESTKPASGVEMVGEGLGATKDGVEQIEKGIKKLKDGDAK